MNTKVFISHQKRDREYAAKIAEYLDSKGIDVYFDEFDRELQIADRQSNPKGVVAAIKKGIKQSTHMLCIVSPNTINSKWVPFELGYGYDNSDIATLTLKGIKNSDLPDYIKTKPIIRDITDLNVFVIKHKTEIVKSRYIESFSSSTASYHPLEGIMDS